MHYDKSAPQVAEIMMMMEEDLQALNNCEVFNQIRADFNNFHKDVKKLNTFNYFSGNEREIKELQRRLIGVLLEHNLVEKLHKEEPDDEDEEEEEDEDELAVKTTAGCDLDQLRGLVMYLILNSANIESTKHDIKLPKWNPQCVHLLNQLTAPLAQLVTVSLAIGCGLQQQFFEFISCAPHWLSVQYIDSLNETMSHLVSDSHESLPLVAGTLMAVTKALSYQTTPANPELLLQASMRLLQRHLLDNEDRLRLIRYSSGRHRYLGEAMRQLLDVLLLALDALLLPLELPEFYRIYALRSSPLTADYVEQQQQQTDDPRKLRTFAGKLMDAVQRLLPLVSVDAYMTWHELPSGVVLFSLQTHIGNQCAKLLQSLDKQPEQDVLSKHSLRAQLGNFAKGAQTFEERLEQLTLGELLSFLDGDDEIAAEKHQLLAALNQLMQRPIALGSDECIESIAKHVQLLGAEHANLILDHLKNALLAKQQEMEEDGAQDYVDYDEIYGELFAKVLYPIFKALPTVEQKLQLLEKRDTLQLLEHLSFTLSEPQINRIGFFNALSYAQQEFPMLQFLDLCYEQPAETWLSLAQLGMTHREFAKLYCKIVVACAAHAVHHVDYTIHQLMQDETLLTHNNSGASAVDDLLLKLYELPFILHGPCRFPKPINQLQPHDYAMLSQAVEQLKLTQSSYLSACAMGMEKFADAQNYAALGRLADTLLKLHLIENRLTVRSRRRTRQTLAKKYRKVMARFVTWRVSNWKLTFELIATLDKLRANLASFDAKRIFVLDQLMEYYVLNMPRALRLCPDIQCQVKALLETLTHKDLWQDEQLIMLLPNIPAQAKDCAVLLEKASSLEATNMLSVAIRRKLDMAVMEELARSADDAGTTEAQAGYSFLLKSYMLAFKDVLIASSKPSDYPLLVEHLKRTPKLQLPDNLHLASENLNALGCTAENIESVGQDLGLKTQH